MLIFHPRLVDLTVIQPIGPWKKAKKESKTSCNNYLGVTDFDKHSAVSALSQTLSNSWLRSEAESSAATALRLEVV